MPLRKEVVIGLLLAAVLLGIGLLVGQSVIKREREAYVRGAGVAELHHRCRQAYPSEGFLGNAFLWGDPKTCEDIGTVEKYRAGR